MKSNSEFTLELKSARKAIWKKELSEASRILSSLVAELGICPTPPSFAIAIEKIEIAIRVHGFKEKRIVAGDKVVFGGEVRVVKCIGKDGLARIVGENGAFSHHSVEKI